MLFKTSDFDYDVFRWSVFDVESYVHREPAVLAYQKRTLRSSFPNFTQASWYWKPKVLNSIEMMWFKTFGFDYDVTRCSVFDIESCVTYSVGMPEQ